MSNQTSNLLSVRRARLTLVLAALAAGVTALLVIATSNAPALTSPEVLRLVSVDVGTGGGADVPPRGDSVGDTDTFTSVISDAKTGKRLGRSESVCTIFSIAKPGGYGPPVRDATFHCWQIVYLPAGQMTAFGPVSVDRQGNIRLGAFAILGGTGAYASARGWAKGTPLSERKT